jgi:hypothetical protein
VAHEIGYTQVAAGESNRRNGLTRIIGAARASTMYAQPDQLSLAKIREALVTGVAVEEFEAAKTQGRFVRWLERTCRKAVKHASSQSDTIPTRSVAIPEFGGVRLFTTGK